MSTTQRVRFTACLALLTGWLVTLSGCALTEGHVQLDPMVAKVGARGGKEREVVVFPAADTRHDKTRCGVKRNMYGVETADVHCDPDPRVWVAQLVARGLDQAGFKLVTTVNKRTADPLYVRLNLERLFTDQVPGMFTVTLVTDVHVIVLVTNHAGLAAQRSFFAKAENDVAFVFDGGFQTAVDEASRNLADAIVRAIVELSNRYPDPGSRQAARSDRPRAMAVLEVGLP